MLGHLVQLEVEELYLIRRGSVSLQRRAGGQSVTVAEVRAGELVGEMALMGDPERRETAIATVATETVELHRKEFLALMNLPSANIESLQARAQARLTDNTQMEVRPESSGIMSFLLNEGLGEATDTLLIDETLCIGCDNCERACAETHNGLSRRDRAVPGGRLAAPLPRQEDDPGDGRLRPRILLVHVGAYLHW